MRKKLLLLLVLLASFSYINAQHISHTLASNAAQKWLNDYDGFSLSDSGSITGDRDIVLGYKYDLSPTGYLVLSADLCLPPVIAYSFTSAFSIPEEKYNPLKDVLASDIDIRMKYLSKMSEGLKSANKKKWAALIDQSSDRRTFEQWPPAGSTGTGGWLETNWSQSHPYNKFCPMDNINNERSVAGCPSVALAMIIHYQKNLNGIQFGDEDDYFHSYAGRQYWIDDDSHDLDFPAFTVMNEYFDSAELKFAGFIPLNEDEIATLVFGCGVAAQQVYTSEVSGTFGVDQAYDAYLRFGYQGAMLVYDSDTSFYTQMRNNIKESKPVHLAVLSNSGQGGHNVVADGYNTDDFYHLNFGWGGGYNGWYLLPHEIPYNLTIIEGAVLDIGISHVSVDEQDDNKNQHTNIFPNPSTGPVNVEVSCTEASRVIVEVLDAAGSLIKELYSGQMKPGTYIFKWLARVPAGMYYISTQHNEKRNVQKVIIHN